LSLSEATYPPIFLKSSYRGVTRDKMLERFRKARQFTAGVVYSSAKANWIMLMI
jgi:hypothetical protein